jgi:FAD/FMN-containing dehydrogenase
MNLIFLFFSIILPFTFSYAYENVLLTGKVILPNDLRYGQACQIFNNTKNILEIKPNYIVFCSRIEDVVNAVKWSKIHNIQVSIRGGGHGYEGYSLCNGLVIDLSSLNQISLSKDLTKVKLGAGCRLNDVYSMLGKHQRTIIGGSCGTVGISGFTLGGGFGFLSRKYGLAIDNLKEIELVDACGNILIANEINNSDLFWACKGAGGGNFGVVTSLTFETIPIDQVVVYQISWPWEEISDVIHIWQKWAPDAPNELTSVLIIPLKGKGNIISKGVYLGEEEKLRLLLNEELLYGGHPQKIMIETMNWEEALNKLHPIDSGNNKYAFKAKSDYARESLKQEAIVAIIDCLSKEHLKITDAVLILDSYGGAINQIWEHETAFIHRKERFSLQYLAYWNNNDEEAEYINREWINGFYQKMRPYVSGYSYQNYIDKDLENWEEAYYGENKQKLREIKIRYDQENFFRFDQSIPTNQLNFK